MTCYIVCYIMPVLKRLNQYLKCRDGFWSYNRRVPLTYREIDTRGTIRKALATSSIEVARARRDALAAADEAFWKFLSGGDTSARNAYEAARSRAMSKGMIYIPADDLASGASLEAIIKRLRAVDIPVPTATAEADALLGLAKPAAPTIRQAFKIYCATICSVDNKGKSATQLRNWTKGKQRAVDNFVSLCA